MSRRSTTSFLGWVAKAWSSRSSAPMRWRAVRRAWTRQTSGASATGCTTPGWTRASRSSVSPASSVKAASRRAWADALGLGLPEVGVELRAGALLDFQQQRPVFVGPGFLRALEAGDLPGVIGTGRPQVLGAHEYPVKEHHRQDAPDAEAHPYIGCEFLAQRGQGTSNTRDGAECGGVMGAPSASFGSRLPCGPVPPRRDRTWAGLRGSGHGRWGPRSRLQPRPQGHPRADGDRARRLLTVRTAAGGDALLRVPGYPGNRRPRHVVALVVGLAVVATALFARLALNIERPGAGRPAQAALIPGRRLIGARGRWDRGGRVMPLMRILTRNRRNTRTRGC